VNRFDRIARLIEEGLAAAPSTDAAYAPRGTDRSGVCWRCVDFPAEGRSGLCGACRSVLVDEDYVAPAEPPFSDDLLPSVLRPL
jgi:hypothetical protein